MLLAEDIIESAKKYVGIPYHHQGRNRQHGLDCIGLVIVTLEDLGVKLSTRTNYSRSPVPHEFIEGVREYAIEKPVAEMQPGDLVLIAPRKFLQHAAILISKTEIIHCVNEIGVEIRELQDWALKIRFCFDLKGLA